MKTLNIFIVSASIFLLIFNVFPRQIDESLNCYLQYGNGSLLISANGYPFVSFVSNIELEKADIICVTAVNAPYNEGVQYKGIVINSLFALGAATIVAFSYAFLLKRKN